MLTLQVPLWILRLMASVCAGDIQEVVSIPSPSVTLTVSSFLTYNRLGITFMFDNTLVTSCSFFICLHLHHYIRFYSIWCILHVLYTFSLRSTQNRFCLEPGLHFFKWPLGSSLQPRFPVPDLPHVSTSPVLLHTASCRLPLHYPIPLNP